MYCIFRIYGLFITETKKAHMVIYFFKLFVGFKANKLNFRKQTKVFLAQKSSINYKRSYQMSEVYVKEMI